MMVMHVCRFMIRDYEGGCICLVDEAIENFTRILTNYKIQTQLQHSDYFLN
jgi:hypothetical protein